VIVKRLNTVAFSKRAIYNFLQMFIFTRTHWLWSVNELCNSLQPFFAKTNKSVQKKKKIWKNIYIWSFNSTYGKH